MTHRSAIEWFSPKEPPFRIAGFAWFESEGIYRRLLKKPLWSITRRANAQAECGAGGQISFQTNSRRLVIRARFRKNGVTLLKTATSLVSLDCYLGPTGRARYCDNTFFAAAPSSGVRTLFDLPRREMRTVTLNLPLFQAVKKVSIGLEPGSRIAAPAPYDDPRPIVIYGTSITQGCYASRPGMAWTNIVSRRINREFINLGFAGGGCGEPDMARNVASITDPACFVLDYEANGGGFKRLRKTFPQFIRILRRAHPKVPILAISKIAYPSELIHPENLKARLAGRDVQRDTIRKMKKQGDRRLHFHDASHLLGKDFEECTMDVGHPSDMGFMRIADGLTPVLKRVLGSVDAIVSQ